MKQKRKFPEPTNQSAMFLLSKQLLLHNPRSWIYDPILLVASPLPNRAHRSAALAVAVVDEVAEDAVASRPSPRPLRLQPSKGQSPE